MKNSVSLFDKDYYVDLIESKDKTTAFDLAVFVTYILLLVNRTFGMVEEIRIAIEPDYLFLPIYDSVPLINNLFDAFKGEIADDFSKTSFADIERIALLESKVNPSIDIRVFDALEIRLGMLSNQMTTGCGVRALAEINLSETRVHLFLPFDHKFVCLGTTTIDIGLNHLMGRGTNKEAGFAVFANCNPSMVTVPNMLKLDLQNRIAYAIVKMWATKGNKGKHVSTFYCNELKINLPIGCIAFVGVGATVAGMARSYQWLLSVTPISTNRNEGIRNNQRFSMSQWMPFISLPFALLEENPPLQRFEVEKARSELKSFLRFKDWLLELSQKGQSGTRDDVNNEHG